MEVLFKAGDCWNYQLHNDLPASLKEDDDLLKDIDNAETLKKILDKEEACPAREWVRNILLGYFTLFKWGYLPPYQSTRRGHDETGRAIHRYGF